MYEIYDSSVVYGNLSASTGVYDGSVRVYSTNNNPDISTLSGKVQMVQLSASGTPSSTTYLRGDGSWSTVSGGGSGGSVVVGNLSASPTSVISITNGTSAVVGLGTGITISQATTTTNGYVSSGDWNTFNSKFNAASSGLFSLSGHSHYTSGLSDVSAVSPTDLQTLVFLSAVGKYVPIPTLTVAASDGSGSSGVLTFGGLGINTDNTKFDVGAIQALFADNTANPLLPTMTVKSFPATSGNTLTNLTTQDATYLAVDINGTIHQSSVLYTPTQTRDWIPIGNIVHSNRQYINTFNNGSHVAMSPANQLGDLMDSIGVFNIDGNVFTANDSNMAINKSVGNIFK